MNRSRSHGVQFALLILAAIAGFYARTVVSPLQEAMRTSLALTDNQMALLQGSALALLVVLTAIPLGLAIDRYSRVRLLVVFAVSNLMGTLLTAAASNFAVLFAARCIIGLATNATAIAAFSLLADLFPPAQRGRATMLLVIGQFAGAGAAFGLGGALLSMSDAGPDKWRWALYWLGGPLLPVVFLLLAMREPLRTGLAIENASMRDAFVEFRNYRAIIAPLLTGLVLAEMASVVILVWAAPALTRDFSLPPQRVGAIMSTVVILGGVAGSIGGGILADICQRTGGPRRTVGVLSFLALTSAPAGLFAIVPGVTMAFGMLLLFVTAVGAIVVMAVALFTIVIPNELRGLCLASMIGANNVFAVALAPLVVSMLSNILGGPQEIGTSLAIVCMASNIAAAAALAFGIRHFPGAAASRNAVAGVARQGSIV